MDRNNKIPQQQPVQFTKLTYADIHKHRVAYVLLLMGDKHLIVWETRKELTKVTQRFCNTFK